MPNSLLVSLSDTADAVRISDIVRLLRGVDGVETVPDSTLKRLQEAIRGMDSLRSIDNEFLKTASRASRVLNAARVTAPAEVASAAFAAGVSDDELDAASGSDFVQAADDALRVTEAMMAVAPDLLRRGGSSN